MDDEKPPGVVRPTLTDRIHFRFGNGCTLRFRELPLVYCLPSPDLRAGLRYDLPVLETHGERE